MENSSDFNESLSFGNSGEYLMGSFFIRLINEKMQKLNRNLKYSIVDVSKEKDWDFKAIGYDINPENGKVSIFPNEAAPKLHVEVKTDKYEKKTNNLFIELRSRGRKSGILTTKSEYYIYFFIRKDFYPKNNVFVFKTENLREIIKGYQHKVTTGGDHNTSVGVLLSFDELMMHSDKFQNFTFTDYEYDLGDSKVEEKQNKTMKVRGIDIFH